MARTLDISKSSFELEVLKSDKPVLADFWAEWCGPCRVMYPVLEQLAGELDGRLKVVRINVDENPELASRYNVYAIPTFIIFRSGSEIDRMIGAMPRSSFFERVEKVISRA